jgi:hypothetical protein
MRSANLAKERSQQWAACALWLMLAVSAGYIIFAFVSHYGSCRADGTGKIGCFLVALFASLLEALAFAFVTVVKILTFILP